MKEQRLSKSKSRRRLSIIASVAVAMFLAGTAQAVVMINAVGGGSGYDDTTPAFLSTNVAKTSDLNGDNVYGTAGYFMFGADNGLTNQSGQPFGDHVDRKPLWVSSVAPGADFNNVAYGFGHYTTIDNPTLAPGVNVADWTPENSGIATATNGGAGSWRQVVDFTIAAGTPQQFRVGVMAGNEGTNDGRWDPTGLRLTGPDGSIASVTALPNVDPGLGWVFFDVDTGGATGGVFTVHEQQRTAPQGGSIGGITFDAAPVPPATIAFAGSIADNAGNEVLRWRTAGVAKSFDADGDNVYGTAGYSIFGGTGSGGAANLNAGLTESQVAGLSLIHPGSFPLVQMADFNGAADWDDPNALPAVVNMGYAGPRDNNGGPVALSHAFSYLVEEDFDRGLRMGIAADSLGDARILIDQLQVVVGSSQASAVIVPNNNNGSPEFYFFDLFDLRQGQVIEIWLAHSGTSNNFIWPTINGVTFDLVPIPEPTAGLLTLISLGALARRRRHAA